MPHSLQGSGNAKEQGAVKHCLRCSMAFVTHELTAAMVAHVGPAQNWALSNHYCGRGKQNTLLQDDKHRKCSQQCCHLSVQCPVSRPSNRRRHPHCLYTLPQITPIFLLKTGQGFLLEGHLFKVNTPRAPRQTVMAPLFLVRVAKVECLT